MRQHILCQRQRVRALLFLHQRIQIALRIERFVLHAVRAHFPADLLRATDQLLLPRKHFDLLVKRGKQLFLTALKRLNLFERDAQRTQKPNTLQDFEVLLRIIAVAVLPALRGDQTLHLVKANIRARHAGQIFDGSDSHTDPPYLLMSPPYTVKLLDSQVFFAENTRFLQNRVFFLPFYRPKPPRPRPLVKAFILPLMASSAWRSASLTAEMMRSCSISTSSGSTASG